MFERNDTLWIVYSVRVLFAMLVSLISGGDVGSDDKHALRVSGQSLSDAFGA